MPSPQLPRLSDSSEIQNQNTISKIHGRKKGAAPRHVQRLLDARIRLQWSVSSVNTFPQHLTYGGFTTNDFEEPVEEPDTTYAPRLVRIAVCARLLVNLADVKVLIQQKSTRGSRG
ncbi:hypothetical protein B0O80DRAFT_431666 [Mortierella sp. GBAus27b]|nr:hypothetical protein B0O80DRAFT_431666 [Mortierella sp. GBAus27b]